MSSQTATASVLSLPVVASELPPALKPPVGEAALAHRNLRQGEFWRAIPAFRDIDTETFLDHHFQSKHSITRVDKLLSAVQDLVSTDFYRDLTEGFARAPMNVRVSPYMIALIDWNDPHRDPIRRQFLPVASSLLPDHPKLGLDSLAEKADAPVPGLTHRYPDKALFLTLDTCPVYCRFCTRSYAVGGDTDKVEKYHLKANSARWDRVFAYVRSRPELEDIVISGGDSYNLRAEQITAIGDALLAIPHVRRMRFATKGPAVMPQKLLTDDAWFQALVGVTERGRKLHKEVVLHTHFNHPDELTWITQAAMDRLFEHGVTVRNQSVLLRGVNDDAETMRLLVRRLGHLNVHAYYVYQHDMVQGVEDLRTTVATAIELEKQVRGATAGFNTPTFVVDAPGGGGKRDVHSFEHYDRVTGISVYRSPNVASDRHYLYFDPIDQLPEEGRRAWADPGRHASMIEDALTRVRAG